MIQNAAPSTDFITPSLARLTMGEWLTVFGQRCPTVTNSPPQPDLHRHR